MRGPTLSEIDSMHECTAADPWTPQKGPRAFHPDAKVIGETDEYERLECPNCKHTFRVTLPSH